MKVVNNSLAANMLLEAILDGMNPKQALKRANNVIRVVPDPSHDGYYHIPVFDVPVENGHLINMFKPGKNPRNDIRARLQHLVSHRRGYQPGQVFNTPWGLFLVHGYPGYHLTVKEM